MPCYHTGTSARESGQHDQRHLPGLSLSHFKILLLVFVTILAAFLRLYRIDTVPPGDGHDPALYGVDALAILEGERPIFLESNFGREALYSYLVAACFLVLGPGTLAIHVTSAIVGILTVPAVFLAAEALFATDEDSLLSRYGGLLSALVMAISYWHLNWSRYGVRAILIPLFAALVVYSLWRGFRTGSRWAFAGCGFFLGASMYTYQAARLLPLLVLVGYGAVVKSRRSLTKADALNLGIVVAISMVVFAPLGYYFVAHPGSFGGRVGQAFVLSQASETAGRAQALLDQAIRLLLMFGIRGEREAFSTIPQRPLLNPFLALAFCLGIIICLRRLRKPSFLLVIAWLALMSVPGMLAYGSRAKRTIGALPAVAMLIAIGLLVPCDAIRRRMRLRAGAVPRIAYLVATLIVVGGLVYSGGVTYRDYFLIWAKNPALFVHFEVGLSEIGRYVGQLPPDERVYVTPAVVNHPSIVLHSGLRQDVKGYNGRACIVLPAATSSSTTYVVIPSQDKNSLSSLAHYYPQGAIVAEGPLHYNQSYFLAYQIPANSLARIEPAYRRTVTWDDRIQLLGYDLDKPLYHPGEAIQLTLYYRRVGEIEANYTVFTHLWGPDNPATGGPVWGQDDSEPCRRSYPTSLWDMTEIVVDAFSIPIAADAPAGDYNLAMGFYHWQTLERLPIADATTEVSANAAILGPVDIVIK
jgi:hypothetical protein